MEKLYLTFYGVTVQNVVCSVCVEGGRRMGNICVEGRRGLENMYLALYEITMHFVL